MNESKLGHDFGLLTLLGLLLDKLDIQGTCNEREMNKVMSKSVFFRKPPKRRWGNADPRSPRI